jgi:hypothetical protein
MNTLNIVLAIVFEAVLMSFLIARAIVFGGRKIGFSVSPPAWLVWLISGERKNPAER